MGLPSVPLMAEVYVRSIVTPHLNRNNYILQRVSFRNLITWVADELYVRILHFGACNPLWIEGHLAIVTTGLDEVVWCWSPLPFSTLLQFDAAHVDDFLQ